MGNAPTCVERGPPFSRATSVASSLADAEDVEDEDDFITPERCLEVYTLDLGGCPFNPFLPQLRSRLLDALGASPASQFKEFKGCYAEDTNKTIWFNAGNSNEGIWFMQDCDEEFVLKLVKANAQNFTQCSESDHFQRLYQEMPYIVNDLSVGFPIKIFKIVGPRGVRQYDLHIMRRVPGRSLETIIEGYWKNGRKQELKNIFRRVGEFVRHFHERYNSTQHNDVGPQNIFFDEATEQVSIIDLGMMGFSLTKNDCQVFASYVHSLVKTYGPEILKGVTYFDQGYSGSHERDVSKGGA